MLVVFPKVLDRSLNSERDASDRSEGVAVMRVVVQGLAIARVLVFLGLPEDKDVPDSAEE